MLATHIYYNGTCMEAIDLYVKAFHASIKTLIQDPGRDNFVVHAELLIHNQVLIMNDFGDNDGPSKSGGYQLSVNFDTEDALKKAYQVMEGGSIVVSPMRATVYSPCVVRFIDRFDVRWGFWVGA